MIQWLIGLLAGLFSTFGVLRHRKSPRLQRLAILVWAPSIDALTEETASWASELVLPRRLGRHRLEGTVFRHEIEQCLEKVSEQRTIALFLGHGLSHALIGHPATSEEGFGSGSPIYDRDLLDLGPTSLFAFCCDAGKELGPNFALKRPGAFLGFAGEIGIDARNSLCRQMWIDILQETINQVIEDQGIRNSHKSFLHGLYEEAFWYFQTGGGLENSESMLMKMYLVGHQEALVCH